MRDRIEPCLGAAVHSDRLEPPRTIMESAMDLESLTAPISYVASIPEGEKAYHMMYGDSGDLPRTNITRKWHETTFYNIRGKESLLSFTANGVAVCKLDTAMTYYDFDNDETVWNVYFKELESYLQEFLGARDVKLFRYGIRKRHAEFPISTGKDYQFAQPTSIAHVDATLHSTQEEMVRQFGDRAEDLQSGRYQWVNVWKPLRGPMNDWPLCFCDASSVHAQDSEATDMVYPDYFTENLSLRFREGQRWYYLADHRTDEIIVFKQSDSDSSAVAGVPHCSFANPKALANEMPRESIEARALVIY